MCEASGRPPASGKKKQSVAWSTGRPPKLGGKKNGRGAAPDPLRLHTATSSPRTHVAAAAREEEGRESGCSGGESAPPAARGLAPNAAFTGKTPPAPPTGRPRRTRRGWGSHRASPRRGRRRRRSPSSALRLGQGRRARGCGGRRRQAAVATARGSHTQGERRKGKEKRTVLGRRRRRRSPPNHHTVVRATARGPRRPPP